MNVKSLNVIACLVIVCVLVAILGTIPPTHLYVSLYSLGLAAVMTTLLYLNS